jgi:uncharacterized protein (TIGR02145 family)
MAIVIMVLPSCLTRPEVGPNEVVDIDGNVYATMDVGSLRWMRENLRTGHYNDGVPIAKVDDKEDWGTSKSGAFSSYNDEQSNHVYGHLYNGHAVLTGKLCPDGWHIPTEIEWETLIQAMGGEQVAGRHLKSKSRTRSTADMLSTDSIGFSALPGGVRGISGDYSQIGQYGVWWTSTTYLVSMAWYYSLSVDSDFIGAHYAELNHGFSCRCVMPIETDLQADTIRALDVSK